MSITKLTSKQWGESRLKNRKAYELFSFYYYATLWEEFIYLLRKSAQKTLKARTLKAKKPNLEDKRVKKGLKRFINEDRKKVNQTFLPEMQEQATWMIGYQGGVNLISNWPEKVKNWLTTSFLLKNLLARVCELQEN